MTEPPPGPTPWTDAHCHLPPGSDADPIVAAAHEAGVVRLVTVGTDVPSSKAALATARRHQGVFATAGVHPHDADGGIGGLDDLFEQPEVVAVGECGLDYHYRHSPVEVQREVFGRQIELANELDLPLVVHTREAWEDTFELLDRHGVPARTVLHCFTGGPAEAAEALRRGALLSISGIVTFASAGPLREAVASTPLERLMVETDSPYLAPAPHRGTPNTPERVVHVGAAVAELQGRALAEVAEQTLTTTVDFYGLDPTRLLRSGPGG